MKARVRLAIEKAEQGDAAAAESLGIGYMKGALVKKSHKKAARYFRIAAEQGMALSQLCMGF